jgi:hypothetical protein
VIINSEIIVYYDCNSANNSNNCDNNQNNNDSNNDSCNDNDSNSDSDNINNFILQNKFMIFVISVIVVVG